MSRALLLVVTWAVLAVGCDHADNRNQPLGKDFVLQTAEGPFDSKAHRGEVLLLYFGYTHCPDICPTSLASGGKVLRALTADERKRVKLLLISVDPERDTPNRLKEYAAFFNPEMVGATGTQEDIAVLAKAFGAGYVKQAPKADGSYAVDHTSLTYVIGPDGKLARSFDINTSVETLVSFVRSLL